jgi:hypothetical protein
MQFAINNNVIIVTIVKLSLSLLMSPFHNWENWCLGKLNHPPTNKQWRLAFDTNSACLQGNVLSVTLGYVLKTTSNLDKSGIQAPKP